MYSAALRQRVGFTQSACLLGTFSRPAMHAMDGPQRRNLSQATAVTAHSAPGGLKGRRHKRSSSAPVPLHQVSQPLPPDPLKNYRALVLDSGYRPIDVVNWQRAICLDIYEKVDVLEYFNGIEVHSAHSAHVVPAVVRVRFFVRKHWRYAKVALSRRNILLRDRFACQYCGARENLTLDHVKPVSKGGAFSWTNCVTACTSCNSRKGNTSLKKMGWMLRKQPREPSAQQVVAIAGMNVGHIRTVPKEWTEYLFPGEAPCFQGPAYIQKEATAQFPAH